VIRIANILAASAGVSSGRLGKSAAAHLPRYIAPECRIVKRNYEFLRTNHFMIYLKSLGNNLNDGGANPVAFV
jgi:hypothetical protein